MLVYCQLGYAGRLHHQHSASNGQGEAVHREFEAAQFRRQRTWSSMLHYISAQLQNIQVPGIDNARQENQRAD